MDWFKSLGRPLTIRSTPRSFQKELHKAIHVDAFNITDYVPDSIQKGGFWIQVENAMLHINQFEDGIETVERELLMEALYPLGESVGLSRDTEFLERWRGDW
ncbi:hypothetical protein [Pseudomonas triticifolii]|uniref:Uncharacterized protein n=1 Tax=Pseudomonas triticifolii TaxID=2762592 RepID=A0ABR7B8N8_9PSED|nr:hypothetical protein [Pseudomonas triticifolii]MBC3953544.1 hypothetical protein [Pseudomonas triticifolii]